MENALRSCLLLLLLFVSHQRRIPMPFIFDVLNVTGRAIGLVGGNQHTAGAQFHAAVVAFGASSPWRLSIDRVESFVAA